MTRRGRRRGRSYSGNPRELQRLLRVKTTAASEVVVRSAETGEVIRVEDPKPLEVGHQGRRSRKRRR